MKILFLDWLRWTFSLENHYLKNFLSSRGVECKEIRPGPTNWAAQKIDIPLAPKAREEYRGFNIRSFIKTSVLREAKWYNPRPDLERKYMRETITYINWMFGAIESERPDYIVVEGGLTHFHRACVEVARECNIGIIAVENSFINDKVFIEFNTGYVCNRTTFSRSVQDWLDTRVLTHDREKKIDAVLKALFKSGLRYPTEGDFNYKSIDGRKIMFVPLQVFSDQVTAYDSKYNNKTFVEEMFTIAEGVFSDWIIILKCHPKEEKVRFNRNTGNWIEEQEKPKNMILIRQGKYNTQALMRKSNLIVVNNTQAGLEAALLGKPVVVLGDAFYANKGFTYSYRGDWEYIKENYKGFVNIQKAKLFFFYLHNWLYDRALTEGDKERIRRRLNI